MKNIFLAVAAIVSAFTFSACGNNHEDIEGVKTFVQDGFEVAWIRDNAEPKLMERDLFPDATDSLIASLGLENGIPASMSTFLVRKDGMTLLFDTGLGVEDSRLPAALDALGVKPEDIDCIFLTHLHGDHIGGMMKDGAAVFPDAEIYLAKAEYDGWMAMPAGQNSLAAETLSAYGDRVHLFSECDSLPCGVRQIAAYGHTPGHTVYQAGHLLIAGDIMHGVALQFPNPEICADFDMDKPASAASRLRIMEYAHANGLTMIGMHFPFETKIQP